MLLLVDFDLSKHKILEGLLLSSSSLMSLALQDAYSVVVIFVICLLLISSRWPSRPARKRSLTQDQDIMVGARVERPKRTDEDFLTILLANLYCMGSISSQLRSFSAASLSHCPLVFWNCGSVQDSVAGKREQRSINQALRHIMVQDFFCLFLTQ